MTTIVGIKTHRGVLIAADKRLTSASGDKLGLCSKLIELPCGTCLAVAAPYTAILALRDCLDESEFDGWTTDIGIYRNLTTLHGTLKESHYMRVDDTPDVNAFDSSHFQMLVGNGGNLWLVLHMREVIEVADFTAAGSGREYALGSLASGSKIHADNAKHLAELAVSVASRYDAATGLEVDIWQSNRN